jgi:hypothetical protein
MAAKDYIWDSQAAKRIRDLELDKHYAEAKNKTHYDELAKEVWQSLKKVSDVPAYLKHDDLWDSLYPIITRDSVTLKAMADRKLPAPLARGGTQWFAWFTHYVVEQYLESTEEDEST